jgi:diaminopimelate epimerase
MRFVKMHGIGNDYIYIDAFSDPAVERSADWPQLARDMSHRHTGIGADGVILVCRPAADGDVRMRMFNADGSESEMCGNGIRCVAKFAHDRLGITARPPHPPHMAVETGRGTLSIEYTVEAGALASATVDMGQPILDLPDIPLDIEALAHTGAPAESVCDLELELGGELRTLEFTPVSMGNPHAVFFEDANRELFKPGLRSLELDRIGTVIEHHAAFPRRVNAHFVTIQSPGELTMRTWERGTGETQACGTGACAVLVAAALTGRAEREAVIHLPGGDLRIAWRPDGNHVFKTGPATEVFEGDWPARAIPPAKAAQGPAAAPAAAAR